MVFSSAWVQYKIILYQKKLKSKLRNSIKVIAKDCPDQRIKKFKWAFGNFEKSIINECACDAF